MKRSFWVIALVALTATLLLAAPQSPDSAAAQIARVEAAQSPNRGGLDPYTLPQIMERLHIPGVSIAVAKDFHVQWAKTYGTADVSSGTPVTSETRFQAASISKPVTAFAVLRAVEARRLSLDENVNRYLKSWKVPDNEFTRQQPVTLRSLLSHTSGTGDGFGFPGYSPNATLPTLVQILDGKPPSNVGPVFWERPPFAAFKYSGGGIVIVQLVLQDVYGKPFTEIMRQLVLEPVGMSSSTFEQPLPAEADRTAARAHNGDGKAMDAKWHVYPEQAAAGLWTTPTDLLKLGIELQKALRGESKLLSHSIALEMVAPVGTGPYAIGFDIEKRGEGWYFTHGGDNWGFHCDISMHRLKGYGVAVMANGDSGGRIIAEIEARIAATPPKWHDNPKLVPLVLAGGWNASNEHDCAIIGKLCNSPYDDVDAEARRFSSLADAPLDLETSVWTLRSAKDAFTLLGQLIDAGHQRRFREVCLEVFSEQDRTLDVPEDKKPIVPTRGADFRHSEWLRRGLARTLLMISGLHAAARFRVVGSTPQQYVDDLVGSIPRIAEDTRVLASLKSEFPSLVEAAPVPLASALERVLEGDSEKWARVVFRDKDEGLFGSSSPHTYLLWGLETMAWNPEYLHRAASLLMTLAEFDPDGRLSNRPLESLREIFLAWGPNTYAGLEERIAVLRSVCRKRPKVGLKLAMSLLPSNHDFSHPTAKPRIKDFGEAQSKPRTSRDVHYAFLQYAALGVELAGTDASQLMTLIESLPQLEASTRTQAMLAISTSAKNADADTAFQLWSKLHDLVQKHRNFRDAGWALPGDQLKPLEELCKEIEPADPIKQIVWLFNDYAPTAGSPKGQDYLGEANRDRAEALRTLLSTHGLAAVLDLAKTAKLPHFVGVAFVESGAGLKVLQDALSSAIGEQSGIGLDFAIAISAAAHATHGPAWDSWIGPFANGLRSAIAASLFLRWPDDRKTWDFVAALSPDIDDEYWRRKWPYRTSTPDDLTFAFNKYVHVGRFSAIVHMVSYSESALSTEQSTQVLKGLIGELNTRSCRLQDVQYEVVHMIQVLQQRNDVNLNDLAAIEYQFLPLLEFQAEPIALNRLLGTSPDLFMSVISDAFSPASGETGEITEERRLRARLAYQLLHSMKTVPGFSAGAEDSNHLRSWISEVRKLAEKADRAVITDQQIGQLLAFAPVDKADQAWPARPIRDLIEELGAEQIELGIAISRFNQRGSFTKALYDGGKQERALATQYRSWSNAAGNWPRTRALLRRIADDWDRQAERADSEALLDQLRHSL